MEKMGRIGLCLCVMLYLLFSPSVYVLGKADTDKKAVVFLLDASGSMKTNDPQRYAIDSIAQLIYSLPENYEVGFVAYNTEVCAYQNLLDNAGRGQIMTAAQAVVYDGYSNAGAGLAQAVDILTSGSADEKSIVMLSDGEFLMADETLEEQSRAAYQAATDKAVQNGIAIHVIGLGEDMGNAENSIFQAASLTAGSIYYTPQALELPTVMNSILTEDFGIKQVSAAIIDTDGETEQISVELPFLYADTVKVLLTSDSSIQNVKTNFKADNALQTTGERYSLIQINNPQSSQIELSFVGTAGSRVWITLIAEYKVSPKVSITYKDKEPADETAIRYEREALLEYTFYDADNENIQLWTEDYFNYGKISVQSGELTEEKALENGRLTDKRIITEELSEEIHFDCTAFPVNVLTIEDIVLEFEEAPLLPIPEPEPPYMLYGIVAIVILGIVVILIFRRPEVSSGKKAATPLNDRPAPGKSSYVGKINIYITRTPSGYDIDPLSYNLFRLPGAKVISLAEILESCGVKEIFEGADRIYLSSGQGKSVILTNQSDCCIMRRGEILMKRRSYPLSEDTKVDVTFEDEMSELTFQYKVLKSSQMG
ncbi:MAG: VWA domain-containing protein [Lachnospiraceae bacterium]|nr:VWA domain-containing protein [Lachnospiraceae bacterium]